jgi:ATP-dependent exoDNAse (exonuclease V) beta subunit
MTNYTVQYKDGDDVDLEYNDEKHTYMVEGKQVPAVTRVVDAVSPKSLTEWAAKAGAEMQAIVYDGIRFAHKEISREAQNIGSDVHKWIELWIKFQISGGESITEYPEDVRVPMENFHKWVESREVEWIASEKKIYSKFWNYAGTIDALAKINGELYVIDFKTSAKIYKEYYLQVYGYAQAIHEMVNGLNNQYYPKGMIVRLDKNEDKFQEVAFECEPRVFHNALSIKAFQSKRIKKLKI